MVGSWGESVRAGTDRQATQRWTAGCCQDVTITRAPREMTALALDMRVIDARTQRVLERREPPRSSCNADGQQARADTRTPRIAGRFA